MVTHFCTQYPCSQCTTWNSGPIWTMPARFTLNGLCECRGPLARHPFHVEPLPPEYVGRHRKPEGHGA